MSLIRIPRLSKCKLAFIFTNSLNNLLPTRARCGRMNSPLVLNTHSTGAEVAGEQNTSKSACKTLNAGFRLTTAHNSFNSSSRFTDARRWCLIFQCYVTLLSSRKFSRTWTSEDEEKDKDLSSKDKDKDLKIGPRGSSRTRTFLEDKNTG